MPNDREIDAPFSFGGLFNSPEENAALASSSSDAFENESEEQTINVAGLDLKVRQFVFHSHNANRVWPGTFNLAEYYLCGLGGDLTELTSPSSWVLELGSATGLLALRLSLAGVSNLVTSDVDDGGDVAANIRFNYERNGLGGGAVPQHVAHTWGTEWRSPERCSPSGLFDVVLASDILLYVAAYPALVKTLAELLPFEGEGSGGGRRKFVMSWNRRMEESGAFFEMMKERGFDCEHVGRCVFVFKRVGTGTSASE